MFGPVSSQIAPFCSAVLRRQVAVVGDEGCFRLPSQRLLDHRVSPGLDFEGEAAVDLGTRIVLGSGQAGECRRHVEHRKRFRAGADFFRRRNRFRHQPVENGELYAERAVGRVGDLALQLGKLRRGEAHGVRHGLTVDEAALRLVRAVHDRLMVCRHLDVVSQHIVVPDFQRSDAGLLDQPALQPEDHAPRLGRQPARSRRARGRSLRARSRRRASRAAVRRRAHRSRCAANSLGSAVERLQRRGKLVRQRHIGKQRGDLALPRKSPSAARRDRAGRRG